ncbi:UNVERIFIED_CONTAM: putative polyol transporter 4 [Sesamum calycinum]|uniref:Polyol transporter 4 n=1 Tax=Sesamum calycinum TaxID=2727403 RepID=A0AAW2PN28_9LAMI
MLITGFGIQCFQQITGIDATVYYSPEIFKAAGIVDNSKLLAATVAVGVTKTAFILTAIFLIDKVGRKPLLYVSTIGMTVCLFSLGSTLSFVGEGSVGVALSILSVCGNVAFFSVGIGPVCWVLTSEIFPLKVRAQASALGAVALSALSVAFVYKCVPETKGKSLEQIELLFQDGYELQGSEVQLGDVEHLVLKE